MIELLFPFTWLVASALFFPVFFVLLAFMFYNVTTEHGFWSVTTTFFVGVIAVTRWPELMAFAAHPWNLLVLFGCYLVLGVIWSYFKWFLKNREVVEQIKNFKNQFLKDNKLPLNYFAHDQLPQADKQALHDFTHDMKLAFTVYGDNLQQVIANIMPRASKNKASITLWMMYWPISIVWFCISDLFTNIVNFIYNRLGRSFQMISDRMAKDAMN